MPKSALSGLLRRLKPAMLAETLGSASDGELLERFLVSQDEVAYLALLSRHGPMVLRVCRRALSNEHDAEDAFQATFLILARKARTIRRRASLASWLHGVARRVALEARADLNRRQRLEKHAGESARRARVDDATPWGEIREILDEELEHLSERLKGPIVHCYLEGLTQDEAARRLGVSKNTVRRRLDRGRALLAARLTRRGVALSTALFVPLVAHNTVPASIPLELAGFTAETAVQALVQNGRIEMVSMRVNSLMEGVLKSMVIRKMKMAACLLTALAGIVLGFAVFAIPGSEKHASAQAPIAPDLSQVKDKLIERREKFRSVYIEYSEETKPDVEFKHLWGWGMPIREGQKREETVGFAGDRRYYRMIIQFGSIPLKADEIVPEPGASESVKNKVAMCRKAGTEEKAELNSKDSEIVFDGTDLWSRPSAGLPFGHPAPSNFGESPHNQSIPLCSPYLEALGLRPPSPRGAGNDITNWLPDSLREFDLSGVSESTDMVDGKRCRVLWAKRTLTSDRSYIAQDYGEDRTEIERWWLDPELGWAPRKREITANKLLREKWEFTKFEEAAPGCWLPKEIRIIRGTPFWAAPDFRNRAAYTRTIKVTTWQINSGDRLDKALKVVPIEGSPFQGKRAEDK